MSLRKGISCLWYLYVYCLNDYKLHFQAKNSYMNKRSTKTYIYETLTDLKNPRIPSKVIIPANQDLRVKEI